MTTRRRFLTACIATFSAPAIVRASSLMPVKVRRHWMDGVPLNEWVFLPVPFGGMVAIPSAHLLPNIHSDAPTNRIVEFSEIIVSGGFTDLPE
jgi:hypothetical protein